MNRDLDDIPDCDEVFGMVLDLHESPETLSEETLFLFRGTVYRLTITRDDD